MNSCFFNHNYYYYYYHYCVHYLTHIVFCSLYLASSQSIKSKYLQKYLNIFLLMWKTFFVFFAFAVSGVKPLNLYPFAFSICISLIMCLKGKQYFIKGLSWWSHNYSDYYYYSHWEYWRSHLSARQQQTVFWPGEVNGIQLFFFWSSFLFALAA